MGQEVSVHVNEDLGEVSAVLDSPGEGKGDARALLVLAHGAGAGMHHAFMADVARRLVARSLAVFRFQFPFTEAGRKRPDRAPVCEATVRAAVAAARKVAPGLPLFAGGKSMGGRMTSRAAAEAPLPGVRGLVFLGFPLHPAGKPGTSRADHLSGVSEPMLFVQGTRDRLADLELLGPIVENLGDRATLHIVETADHGFSVLKRTGRTDDGALDELADAVATFCLDRAASPGHGE